MAASRQRVRLMDKKLIAILSPNLSKTCVKRSLKNQQTKFLKINDSLMKVETILQNAPPLEHSAILLTCCKR